MFARRQQDKVAGNLQTSPPSGLASGFGGGANVRPSSRASKADLQMLYIMLDTNTCIQDVHNQQ